MKAEIKLTNWDHKRMKNDQYRKSYSRWIRKLQGKTYKALLFAMADGKCPKCGIDMILQYFSPDPENSATLDHIIPLSMVIDQGKMGLEIMCKKCNKKKGKSLIL